MVLAYIKKRVSLQLYTRITIWADDPGLGMLRDLNRGVCRGLQGRGATDTLFKQPSHILAEEHQYLGKVSICIIPARVAGLSGRDMRFRGH